MFDAYNDIDMLVFADGQRIRITEIGPETSPITVRTHGLAERGHPEFELVDVSPRLLKEATMLLERAADSAIQRRPFEAGRNWASRLPGGFMVATDVVASAEALRLVDLGESDIDEPPRTAVTAIAVSRARLIQSEAPDLAEAVLREAIAWFPGEPGDGLSIGGELCNQGNSLGYLALSDMSEDPIERDTLFFKATARCRSLVVAELGGEPPPRIPWAPLLADVRLLVATIHHTGAAGPPSDLAPAPGGMCFLLSPVLRLTPEGLTQSVAIGLPQTRAYFFEGNVARWLADPSVHELVAAIYDASVVRPDGLFGALTLSRKTTHEIYETGYRFEDTTPARPFPFQASAGTLDHVPLLSRILGEVGRELYAGLSIPECRALWGLEPSLEAAAIADEKLRALAAQEEAAIRVVYQAG